MTHPITSRTQEPALGDQLDGSPDASSGNPTSTSKHDVATYDASELRNLLTTDALHFDFFVTEHDAQSALAKLEHLAPADFYAALQSLSKGGQLETLLDKLSWEDQCRFLSLAGDKGSVERTAAQPGKGPLAPPGQPELFHMSREFPRCLNDLIHEHSKAQYAEFKRAYDAYTQRYEEALGRCGSLRELQQLGRPAAAGVTREHTAIGDPIGRVYDQDWSRFTEASPTRAYEAVANRMAELTGEQRDGSVWFDFKLERSIPLVTTEVSGRLGPDDHKTKEKVGLVAKDEVDGAKLKVKTFNDGTTSVTAGVAKLEASVTTSADGYEKSSFKADRVKVLHDESGGVGVELTPLKGEFDGASLELGSWAAGNRKAAEVRGGVRGALTVGDFEFKAQVGLGARVLREETVARALSNSHDVFKVPAELEARIPWSQLERPRREALAKAGWSEAHWAAALGRES